MERVLTSGWYVLGPELEAFEAEFARYCGVEYCVGVANCTDALELALLALDFKQVEAHEAVRAAAATLGEKATVEELVRACLKKGT